MGRIIPYIVENKKLIETTNQLKIYIPSPKLIYILNIIMF